MTINAPKITPEQIEENFDEQMGRDIARERAVEQVWPLMGYALKEKTFIG